MPEPYRRKAYLLSDAEKCGSIGQLRCRYCKFERYVPLADLQQLFGDIDCDAVTDRHVWRCESCRSRSTIELRTTVLSAADRQKAIIRRLVRIDYVKRPIWRDELPG